MAEASEQHRAVEAELNIRISGLQVILVLHHVYIQF
jgi:hypothetical protein